MYPLIMISLQLNTVREVDKGVLNYYRACATVDVEKIAALPPMQVSSFQLSRYLLDTVKPRLWGRFLHNV